MTGRPLVCLPPGEIDELDTARIVEVCRWHFGEEAVHLVAPVSSLAYYRTLLPNHSVTAFERDTAVPPDSIMVVCKGYDHACYDVETAMAQGGPGLRLYLLHSQSRLKRLKPSAMDIAEQPAIWTCQLSLRRPLYRLRGWST
jgi:hypothetical protein